MPSPGRLRRAALLFATGLLGGACASSNDITRAPAPTTALPAPTAAAPAPLASGRLPGTAMPTRYALALVVDPAKERFTGDVTIDVEIPSTTSAIVLHGRELTILRAEAMADGQHVPAQAALRMAAGGKEAEEELVLTLGRPVAAGRAQIRIAYSAPLSADSLSGLYRVKDGDASYAFTQFEPMDARRMFPCFDEPGYKVPFDVKVTTPKGNLVVANTNEISRTDSEDGRSTTFSFATTPPLPTYLVGLAVGPLEVLEGPKTPVPIRLVTTKGKTRLGRTALDLSVEMVQKLGEYFDYPYPFPKLDIVAVPEFGYGAMENAGLITFREELVLLDPASASTQARQNMAETVAHEIAHHWFGNLVTMQWWDDLWLNEGFATWMEAKIVDLWRPSSNAELEYLAQKGWVMELDALDSARAVRQPIASTSEAEDAFDGITYVKGSSVLGMVESWLGPDAFRDGVRAYLKEHQRKSATAADLFRALSKSSGRDVWPVASTFLDQPGVPLLRADVSCDKGKGAKVKLAQARYRARKATDTERRDLAWKIPFCIAYEGDKGTPACGLMEGASTEIALGSGRCPRWVYPNAAERGYYRFALPPEGLAALVDAGKTLDARSRVGLVTNAWALVQSGDLGADVLLDLLHGMRRDRQRLVVEQIIATLGKVSQALVDEGSRPAFRSYVSSILLPIAKELGWDPRKTDTDDHKLMRHAVLQALVTLADDPWMTAEADKRAAAYLADPRSVGADTAGIALRASTRRAGEKRLAELEQAIRRAPTPEDRVALVGALGSFADPALLRRGLDLMLTDAVKIQDGYYIFTTASAWAESRPTLLKWVKERLPELKRKMPSFVVTRFTDLVGALCDAPSRAEAAAFFSDGLKDLEGTDRRFQQALETADLCIDLRAREEPRAKKRLVGKKGK